MLLSKPEIVAALEAREIVIEPVNGRNLGTASYGVTLGPHFYRERGTARTLPVGGIDMLCQQAPKLAHPYDDRPAMYLPYRDHVWGRGELLTKSNWHRSPGVSGWPLPGCFEDDWIILLAPGELVLAHTIEFIGSTRGCGAIGTTTQMHSRSTTVRMGQDVCGSGGWGDHGYCNRWTMEIKNNLRYHHVPLVVGRRVAQISFFRTETVEDGEDYATQGGKYCTGAIAEMQEAWKPEMMLPRAYKDREAQDAGYLKRVRALFGDEP